MKNFLDVITYQKMIYYSTKRKLKAFTYTLIAGFSELLGALLAYIFLKNLITPFILSITLAMTAGIMLDISIYEFLPTAYKTKKNKAINANLVSAILGIKGTKLKDIEEFSKANIQFKTIRLEPNGTPKEHMSFETIDFNRWVLDPFEQSQIYERFETTRFLFAVFEFRETKKKNPNRKLYLKEIKLWNMPEEHINKYVYPMWEDTRQVLKEGVKLTQTKKGVSNNLPGATYNGVVHIRPKAQNAADKVQLPDGQMITKQCYWLDRNYISNLLKDNKNDNY